MASTPPPITLDEARAIARLANLELEPEELARTTKELGDILSYVRQLQELDVSEVPATEGGLRAAGFSLSAPSAPSMQEHAGAADAGPDARVAVRLRPDEPRPSLSPDIALREAPRSMDQGFAVPSFVDEG